MVFNLPIFSAASVLPFPAATRRSPVMRNSRERMSRTGNKAHESSTSRCFRANKLTNMPRVRTLSERASMNLPNSETCPNLRANQPSSQSVRAAKRKRSRAEAWIEEANDCKHQWDSRKGEKVRKIHLNTALPRQPHRVLQSQGNLSLGMDFRAMIDKLRAKYEYCFVSRNL